jgi:MFS family permease
LCIDYFPSSKASTSNAIVQAGGYIGAGLCYMNILLIQNYGWRICLQLIALFGLIISLISAIFVKEPKRDQFKIYEA